LPARRTAEHSTAVVDRAATKPLASIIHTWDSRCNSLAAAEPWLPAAIKLRLFRCCLAVRVTVVGAAARRHLDRNTVRQCEIGVRAVAQRAQTRAVDIDVMNRGLPIGHDRIVLQSAEENQHFPSHQGL